MSGSWKARQMVAGRDTLSVMALHYGITTGTIIEVVRESGASVTRADGLKGWLTMVDTKLTLTGEPRNRNRKVVGWSDGQVGVDPATTKLTRSSIMAVAQWKFHQDDENGGDK